MKAEGIRIGAVFRDFGSRTELEYAGDLARWFGVPLTVFFEHCTSASRYVNAGLLAGPESANGYSYHLRDWTSEGLDSEIAVRVKNAVRDHVAPCVDIECEPVVDGISVPDSMIIVDNALAHKRRDISVLAPFGESQIRGTSPILIPLGNGESSRWTVNGALAFAQRLGSEVILWHTTWRDPSVTDPDPKQHVSDGAAQVLKSAQERAAELDLKHRTIVENADGVVEGMIRCALREECSLIIMTRGLATGIGRYGDALLDRASPIPLLLLGRKELR